MHKLLTGRWFVLVLAICAVITGVSCSMSETAMDSKQMDLLYDKYLSAPFNSSILYTSWKKADDIEPEKFSYFYTCLLLKGISEKESTDEDGDSLIPAQKFEQTIQQYFDVSSAVLRRSEAYDESSGMYTTMGIGGAVSCKAVSGFEEGKTLSVSFEIITDEGTIESTGTLNIKLLDNDQFKYISCQMQNA